MSVPIEALEIGGPGGYPEKVPPVGAVSEVGGMPLAAWRAGDNSGWTRKVKNRKILRRQKRL